MGVFETILAESSRKPGGLSRVIERRAVKRDPMLRSSTTALTSHLWELELVPAFGLIRLCEDIDRLATRTLDQNIFFESPVLRSAWPRLTTLLAPRGCWMLCLWESTGSGRELRLFMPLRLNKVGFPARKVLEPLANQFMPLGTPMIDRDCAEEAAETLLRLLADPNLRLPKVIDFTWLREGSESQLVLERAAANLGLNAGEKREDPACQSTKGRSYQQSIDFGECTNGRSRILGPPQIRLTLTQRLVTGWKLVERKDGGVENGQSTFDQNVTEHRVILIAI